MATLQPLSNRNPRQSFCNVSTCRRIFTPQNRGLACSCRMVYYCNRSCQRVGWKEHRQSCRGLRLCREQQSLDLPPQDRRPPIVIDCRHYLNIIKPIINVVARSDLRLGRPDSLEGTHWLHLTVHYVAPPMERWSKSGDQAIGDEQKFFKFQNLTVRPDSELNEEVQMSVNEEEKKKRCREIRTPGYAVVFLYVHAVMPDDPEGRTSINGHYMQVPLSTKFLPPNSERLLNPKAAALVPMTISPALRDKEELKEQLKLVYFLDFAMSERLEKLERLPYRPDEGWQVMSGKVRRLIRDLRQCRIPEVPLYRDLK